MNDFPRRRKQEIDPEVFLLRLAVGAISVGMVLIGWSFLDSAPAGIVIPGVAVGGTGLILGLLRASFAVADWRELRKKETATTAALTAFPNSPRCETCGFPMIDRRHQTPDFPEGIPPWEDASIHLARAGRG